MLCQARIIRVLLDQAGQVVGLEQLTDSVTKSRRRALPAATAPRLVATVRSSVDLAAVAHADDLDEQDRVVHLVHDAVVPDAHAIGAGFS